jgi:predicted dehydrogenase
MTLLNGAANIRLGMAGKVDENDHPYSWSAILNGYDPARLADCPSAVIRSYLSRQPSADFGIPGVRVTHVWCDDRSDAERVAVVSQIPNVVDRPEGMVGQVDAVLIPTDKGGEHVARARPFVEADIPVFIDKPLCDNEADLRTFSDWIARGKPIQSSSAFRYAREFETLRNELPACGELRLVVTTIAKSWERYGIHALEGVYALLPPAAWLSATNTGSEATGDVVHYRRDDGIDVIVIARDDLYGGFGVTTAYGTRGHRTAQFRDSFYAFKRQLEAFVTFLRTGNPTVPFEQTAELMRLLIAGIASRNQQRPYALPARAPVTCPPV